MDQDDLLLGQAREIVLRYGFNATAYQILNPGMEHWMMRGVPAVVGFVRQGKIWVAAGGPVCAEEKLGEAVAGFERAAGRGGARVCYMCAGARLRGLLAGRRDHATVAIGAEPVWRPGEWEDVLREHAVVRSQVRRAVHKGVTVERWEVLDAGRLGKLEGVLMEWLEARAMPPLKFLVGTDALGAGVRDRMLLVAKRGGEVVAFLLASPIPQRKGYLVEQIVRRPGAPNGTAELLIDGAMRRMGREGCEHVTLGLVALARNAERQMRRNPAWLRVLLGWARAHGRRFYRFEGLEAFRTKLAPAAWEPVYAISNEARFSPATLYAIAGAFTDGKPVRAVAGSLVRAVRQEARWLMRAGK